MGGQACIYYGGAEFSRDTDFAVLCEPQNLARLGAALDELGAKVVAVPPFEASFLEHGFAVHFRCTRADCAGLRIDVMSKMRGVAPFPELWERRTTAIEDGQEIEIMDLADLIQAKKTQRDKDWPMIRRLVEAHFLKFKDQASPTRLDFWLRESRTPEILQEIMEEHPNETFAAFAARPWLRTPRLSLWRAALRNEEASEREADRVYWAPLRAEIEEMRLARARENKKS